MERARDMRVGPNPSGLCQCGCGARTNMARQTYTSQGVVGGQPVRYVAGHHRRLSPIQYVVNEATGCWEWQRAKGPLGYGRIRIGGKLYQAHRYFWEEANGPIPEGLQLDHLCRNPSCVNPDHLEPVTNAENSRRGDKARFTWDDIAEMHSLRAAGVKLRVIGEKFGTTESYVWRIVNGVHWRAR